LEAEAKDVVAFTPDASAALPNHVWKPLVEKAGYKIDDIPKTWDAYYDFFKDVQKKLREQGVRNRRSLLHSSIGIVAAGTLVRPFIANAAATTAEVWWPQGFVPEEDAAIKKVVADYDKANGNTIELELFGSGRS
jgi:ABC-type glycerol-3-phosphate transport system substrate-binding protein